MNIVIIGGGKLGAELIDCLSKEDHNIALVDTNYKTVEKFVGKYDINTTYIKDPKALKKYLESKIVEKTNVHTYVNN